MTKAESNRINARKSTGPKTVEGKKKSSMNALKHGFTAKQATIDPLEEELFEDFANGFINCLKPQNEVELDLVDQIISCSWRLKRVLRLETEELRSHYAVDGQTLGQHLFMSQHHKDVFSLSAHETRINGSLGRAYKQLAALRQNPAFLSPPDSVAQPVAWAESVEPRFTPKEDHWWLRTRQGSIQALAQEQREIESLAKELEPLISSYELADEDLQLEEGMPPTARNRERILACRRRVWKLARQLEAFSESISSLKSKSAWNARMRRGNGGQPDDDIAPRHERSFEMMAELEEKVAKHLAIHPDLFGPEEPNLVSARGEAAVENGDTSPIKDEVCPKTHAEPEESSKSELNGDSPRSEAADTSTLPAEPPEKQQPTSSVETSEPSAELQKRIAKRQAAIERLPMAVRLCLESFRICQRAHHEAEAIDNPNRWSQMTKTFDVLSRRRNDDRNLLNQIPRYLLEFDPELDLPPPKNDLVPT